MKFIDLTKGKKTIVDDEDYEYLNQWNWGFRSKGYASRASNRDKITNKQYDIFMHRVIMNCPKGKFIDHINHNTLDNRKCNLRICTHAQNQSNRKKMINTTSKYKGVNWDKVRKKWKVKIKTNNESIHLGYFLKEEDAAKAYNNAAKKYFGEFAKLNEVN